MLAAMKEHAASIGITYTILSVKNATIYVGTNTITACRQTLIMELTIFNQMVKPMFKNCPKQNKQTV
jgi:hypothetical protein